MSFLGSFEHTTGKTWGGTQISPTILKVTSLLGGFVGLDHLLLRSPRTAFYKFLINIITLGLWYWYDLLQVFGEMDFIKTYGYTIPVVGPVGLGAGIVRDPTDPGAAPEGTPSPWMFLAYMLFVFVPFGVSSVVAGDYSGALAKLCLTFFIFTTIFALIWATYSGFYATFQTQELLIRGVDHIFPVSSFIGPVGPAPNLVPPQLQGAIKNAEEPPSSGIIGWIKGLFQAVEKPVLKTFVSVAEPTVEAAETIKNLSKEPVPQEGGGGSGIHNVLTNTAGLLAMQQGGAGAPDSNVKYLFLTAAAIVFVGSIGVTYLRFWMAKKNDPTEHSDKNDFPPDVQNDAPPGPRVL